MGENKVAKRVWSDRSSSEGLKSFDTRGILQKRLVHIVLITALGFLAYSNTFYSPFLFDDKFQIIDNPVIKDLKNFISDRKGYDYNPRRFIGYLSFALNYYFGGFGVIGYHIVNFLIHISNAVLVYSFVLLTFKTPSMLHSTDSSPPVPGLIALFSALLFVSHPLQTEAVTYVIQRFASLATFFYLLSMVTYTQGRLVVEKLDATEGRLISVRSLVFYLVSLLSAVCAMKTKEMAFTLPVVIFLYEIIFFKSPVKKMLFFLLPVLVTLIIVPISILHSHKPLGEILSDVSEQTKVQTQMSRWEYLMTEMRVVVTYIRLIVLPIKQNLDYDYPVYHSLFTLSVFLSFVFLLSVFGLGVYLLLQEMKSSSRQSSTHSRLIGFGILWFFITLSVESSIIPIVDVIYEHRLYLPLVGVFIGMTTWISIAGKRLRIERIVIATLVLMTLVLSSVTYARNSLWKNEITFWQDVVEQSPNKARPHTNLGVAYAAQGQWDRAMEEYQTALRLKPTFPEAHTNLGVAYAAQGQWDRAMEEYQTALRLKPEISEAHNDLGLVYAFQGQWGRAMVEYQAALRLKPAFPEAHTNLGVACAAQGQWDRAMAEYQTALQLKPEIPEAHNDLGLVYAAQGQWDRAMAEYQTALQLKPNYAEAHYNLGLAYASQGQWGRAMAEYQTAVRLKPEIPEAHNNLGLVYASQGQWDRAMVEYQTALQLNPGCAEAHYNLGAVYASQGQWGRAMAEYQTAVRLKPDFYEARQRLNDILSKPH